MNKIHKTKEGKRMYISEMEDTHLMNYIRLALKGIEKIKEQLRGTSEIDPFKIALYNKKETYNNEELSELLENICDNLYPYLAELALRGIDMKDELCTTFERQGSILIESNEDVEQFQHLLEQL